MANGRERPARAGATVADLVADLGHDPAQPGVAVAVNDTVVPRRAWHLHPLADGDRIEVLGAAPGG